MKNLAISLYNGLLLLGHEALYLPSENATRYYLITLTNGFTIYIDKKEAIYFTSNSLYTNPITKHSLTDIQNLIIK